MPVPQQLYKYVGFTDRVLEQLYRGEIHFSDPATFNDPLDCQPIVEPDEPNQQLKQLLAELVVRRTEKEVDVATKMLKLRSDKAAERRQALSGSAVTAVLNDIEYLADAPDVEDPEAQIRNTLVDAIQTEIRKTYDKGVLCLCANWNSPLMWSHYAEQHRGLCIQYDTSTTPAGAIQEIDYEGTRIVRTSAIRRWLVTDDPEARIEIERACLLTKSREWEYESEFRMLDTAGLRASPLDVKGVIFGLRCSRARQYTLVKALEGSGIEFFQIVCPGPRFELKRERVDLDELCASMPLRSALHDFEQIDLGQEAASS
jgi:hypothetical protein